MSLDARYDQTRKRCDCGYGYFVKLEAGQVHETQGFFVAEHHLAPGLAFLLPEALESPEAQHVPVAECVQCRTRYDRHWRKVI